VSHRVRLGNTGGNRAVGLEVGLVADEDRRNWLRVLHSLRKLDAKTSFLQEDEMREREAQLFSGLVILHPRQSVANTNPERILVRDGKDREEAVACAGVLVS
jgi:hypothetical protein